MKGSGMKIENKRHIGMEIAVDKTRQQYLCVHKVSAVSCRCAHLRKKHLKRGKNREREKRKRKIRWTLFNITVRRCVKIIMRIIITECKSFMCEHLAVRFSLSFSSLHLSPFCLSVGSMHLLYFIVSSQHRWDKKCQGLFILETPLNHG